MSNNWQTILARTPPALLLLSLLILPWYDQLRVQLVGIPFTAPELIAWLAIAAWLMMLIFQRQKPSGPGRTWILLGLGWIIAGSISLLWAESVASALGHWKAYIVLPVAIAAATFHYLRVLPGFRKASLQTLFLAGIQVATLCLSQWLIAWPDFTPDELIQGRSTAMFNSANAVGLFLVPISILALAQTVRAWYNQRKLPKLATLILLLGPAAILTTQSQGALIGAIAALLAMLGFYLLPDFQLRWPKGWAIAACVGIFAYVAATIIFLNFFNHPPQVANPYTRPNFTTMTVRQCLWQGTWDGLQSRLLTGYGLANFSTVYLDHHTCDAEPLVYPHNFILNFWVELGLLGLGIALIMVWLVLASRAAISHKPWLTIAIQAVFIYWLIHGLVDVPYFKNDLSVLWWLLLSLLAANQQKVAQR